MKLNQLLLAGLLMAGCSNQSQFFTIESYQGLDESCAPLADPSINGYLDVAAGNPRFFTGVTISGAEQVQQSAIAIGTTQLESARRDRPVITSMVVNYRLSKRVGATPKPYTVLVSSPFGLAGKVNLVMQLISPDLGQALFDGLQASNTFEDFVDLSCDVEFKGEFSNSRTQFTTGVLTYPIRVYRSAPTASCASGFAPFVENANSGEVDTCHYVGQADSQNKQPAPPSVCCGSTSPKSSGC